MRKYLVLIVVCICSYFSNAQNVGIGVPDPQNKLHVGGGFRLDTLTGVGGAGLVWHNPAGIVYSIKLTGNSNDVLRGDGTFASFNVNGATGWLLNGNSGTNPATHFIGTTDNQPLLFKVNNIRHGYLGSSIFLGSNAGISNTVPQNIGIGERSLFSNVNTTDNTAIGIYTLEKNTFGTANIAIGNFALRNNAEGSYNIGIGYLSLHTNTKGITNTAVGTYSLSSNTTGNNNTAVGYGAMKENETGYENTAVGSLALSSTKNPFNTATGFQALMANTFGFDNAAFGHKSLKSNIDGAYNTAVGSSSLLSNTSGRGNTAIGTYALKENTSGYDNTAIGYSTLSVNNGYYNSAMGTAAMVFNTTGHDNTAMGFAALNRNSTASFNTSVGAFAMYSNITGFNNAALGYKALEQNTTGSYNTAMGLGALQGNINGFYNSAFGFAALSNSKVGYNTAVGYSALRENSGGEGNTAVGLQSLNANISGSYNTAIGFLSGGQLPNNVSNVTVIGNGTGWNTTSSNQVNIGNFSVSWIGGQTGWFHYSDKRIKNDIKDDVPGLAFITKLKPITYHVDIDKQEEIANTGKVETNSELIKPVKKDWEGKYDVEKIKMTGFFAQDVEDAAKAINYSFNGVHNPKNGGLLSLDYSAFVVPLVKAVQEQQVIINKQQKLIDDLIKRIEALEKK